MAAKKEEIPTPEDLGLEPTPILENPEQNATDSKTPAGEEPKKRRGRPPKDATKSESEERPKRTASKKAADVEGLAHQIVGLHQFAALATGISELVISPREGEMLAKGLTAVAEEYGLSIGGKTGAALQFLAAAAMVYIPRAMTIKAKSEAAKKAEQSNTVDSSAYHVVKPAGN